MARTAAYSDTSLSPKNFQLSSSSSISPRRSKRSLARIEVPISTRIARKRVNPESLAARLGPELVKELEALLQPGSTEMPPFAVRQALQKRFNINRRHIYDWFHSKGLRVTKEEARTAQDEQSGWVRPQKVPRQIRHPHAPTSTPSVSFSGSDRGTWNASSDPTSMNADHEGSFQDDLSMSVPDTSVHSLYALGLDGDNFEANLTSSVIHTGEDVPPSFLQATPSSLKEPGCKATRTATLSAADCDIKNSVSMAEAVKENIDPFLPLDDQGLLSGSERQALYDGLSGALGPAYGIQESVGTYKEFMLRQRQRYYERLIPSDLPTNAGDMVSDTCSPSTRATSLAPATPVSQFASVDEPLVDSSVNSEASGSKEVLSEYHSWVLYGRRSHVSSAVSSRIQTPDLCSDAGTDVSRCWAPDVSCSGLAPALDIGDILESPVLRSRNPTADAPCLGINVQGWHSHESHLNSTQILGYQALSMSMAPVYRPMLLRHAQSWTDPRVAPYTYFSAASTARWEDSDFALTLQDAKATRGLEKTVADKNKGLGKGKTKGRLGRSRTTTDSPDGRM